MSQVPFHGDRGRSGPYQVGRSQAFGGQRQAARVNDGLSLGQRVACPLRFALPLAGVQTGRWNRRS